MERLAVIGAGTMGNGIAQVGAEGGMNVILYDVDPAGLERGMQRIDKTLRRNVEKGRMTEEQRETVWERIHPSTDIHDLKEMDIVIEAIIEKLEPKKELFAKLNGICKADTIFATNTSGLSITEMAASSGRGAQVVGMHFFNPVPIMKLVEVIRAEQTSDLTVERAHEITQRFNKIAISVKEAPLFAVNRILTPMINEAVFVLMEGIASAEDIDKAMELGAHHPIGPLALADLIGLDTMLFVAETLYEETKDSKYRPAPLMKQYVRAGKLGRKSGEGFFKYE